MEEGKKICFRERKERIYVERKRWKKAKKRKYMMETRMKGKKRRRNKRKKL